MSDDRDHTVATATVTSEEKPYGVRIAREVTCCAATSRPARAVRAGTEFRTTTGIR